MIITNVTLDGWHTSFIHISNFANALWQKTRCTSCCLVWMLQERPPFCISLSLVKLLLSVHVNNAKLSIYQYTIWNQLLISRIFIDFNIETVGYKRIPFTLVVGTKFGCHGAMVSFTRERSLSSGEWRMVIADGLAGS